MTFRGKQAATGKKKRRPLTQPVFEAAIRLCMRTQGANTNELSGIMRGVTSFDAPGVLRGYLKRYRPNLLLYSEKIPHAKKGWLGKLHGNRLTYFIQATCAARCGYPVAYEGDVCGECSCEENSL
jgi:hypothetical protein